MLRSVRISIFALCSAMLIASCAAPAALEPTAAPTAVPTPTPLPTPTVAAGTTVAGIALGGLTLPEAEQALRDQAASTVPAALSVKIDGQTLTLAAADLVLELDVEAVTAALQNEQPLPEQLFTFDETALRNAVADWAEQLNRPAQLSIAPVDGEERRRGFTAEPGRMLDRAAVEADLAELLTTGRFTETLSFALVDDPAAPIASSAELLAALEELSAEWDGVVGVYVYDLVTGTETALNARSVFAGASTVKAPIMLFAYANVAEFSERQLGNLRRAIIDSDNIAANEMLAAGAGGSGTDDAMVGATGLTQMMADLGLEHLYLTVPYESGDYIRLYNLSFPCGPRDPVGEPPYTETGCALRATPYAMGQIYVMIEACADGQGVLLERYPLLTPERCSEMLDLLAENADNSRMVSGIPQGVRVEHKSGWIEDMQADAGIVRSPSGDYVAAIYVYRPLNGAGSWPDSLMAPMVGDVSYLIYSAFNPLVVQP